MLIVVERLVEPLAVAERFAVAVLFVEQFVVVPLVGWLCHVLAVVARLFEHVPELLDWLAHLLAAGHAVEQVAFADFANFGCMPISFALVELAGLFVLPPTVVGNNSLADFENYFERS